MPAAISNDLRQRIVDAHDNGEGTYEEIADRFNVGAASVSRFIRLNRYCGDVTPKSAGGDRRSVEIPDEVAEFTRSLVRDEPNWTTQEIADEIAEGFGLVLSRKRIGRLLHELGFSFKRGSSAHAHL